MLDYGQHIKDALIPNTFPEDGSPALYNTANAALWGERSIRSVANLTRADGVEFLESAARLPVRTTTKAFPLRAANRAIDLLRAGSIRGAVVLVP